MEYSICFLFYWGFFDILSTLGWLSIYIYTHYIIVDNLYMYIYVEGEREKDTTESSTIDGDLSMCVCIYIMYVHYVYLHFSV